VVDDEQLLRRTLESHLTEQGFDVRSFDSATAALNRIEEFDPDIVLTDVRMPGMDGFELLAHLREARPDIDVVIFTGHGDVQGAIEAMRQGASDYLIKPLDLDETESVIEECLAKRARAAESSLDRVADVTPPHGLVGTHPSMMKVYKSIGAVASTSAPVLIRGETGTGKELVARAIHETSSRAGRPFIAVNCAAVPEQLLESELFGHLKGSFTGASTDRRGKFEAASGGTLFLDEVGDTTVAFQAKLLRVLQEGEYYPVGSDLPRRTDARIITATHRSLPDMVERGDFREDLFYRVQVIEIMVPPLRERRSDIPALVRHLVTRASAEAGLTPPVVPPEVMEDLMWREWTGNVRELENVLTRAVIMNRGPSLTLQDVGGGGAGRNGSGGPTEPLTLSEVRSSIERRHVQRILNDTEGNKSRAARMLGVSRPTLNRLIRDHQLVVP
jgi:two-component system response regulator AtoC